MTHPDSAGFAYFGCGRFGHRLDVPAISPDAGRVGRFLRPRTGVGGFLLVSPRSVVLDDIKEPDGLSHQRHRRTRCQAERLGSLREFLVGALHEYCRSAVGRTLRSNSGRLRFSVASPEKPHDIRADQDDPLAGRQ